MIYLDCAATSFQKPPEVRQAMLRAMDTCASVGRGGYREAEAAAKTVFTCRNTAASMFGAEAEQVVFTQNCTHGLNIALESVLCRGGRVAVSGFEHNAVMRKIYALEASPMIVSRRLFSWEDCLYGFEKVLRRGVQAAVVTQVSNVFGYELPVEEIAGLCRQYGTPLVVDAAQSAGVLAVDMKKWNAAFVAMPGHKGLLGPQGTGILLCGRKASPVLFGGTGSQSLSRQMPEELPDRLEAGTMNVAGIAGLQAGMEYICRIGRENVEKEERKITELACRGLRQLGIPTFCGAHQCSVVSFVPRHTGCEEAGQLLGEKGIAVRAGLHCAPLAHESAGTLRTGTVRMSFGPFTRKEEVASAVETVGKICK